MNIIKRFLLTFSLLPLLLIIYLSFINYESKSKLKILNWETQSLPLGTFIFIGGTLGFISSYTLLSINSSNLSPNRDDPINENFNFENENLEANNLENETHTYIERDVRAPSPTIDVPYRIINKKDLKNKNYKPTDSYTDFSSDDDMFSENKSRVSSELSDWDNTIQENW